MTMPVLLLRLAGPMQSWGTQSRFTVRDTGREPSKSGVIGLLCAALGIDREDDEALKPLAALRMGVRVDREGLIGRDYHTAGGGSVPGRKHYGVIKADGSKGETVVSTRYYLVDAEFLVGLEGEDVSLLSRCQDALGAPHWPLWLGRKSFPPGLPIQLPDGLRSDDLDNALRQYPWRPTHDGDLPRHPLRLVMETDDPTVAVRRDQPISFRNGARAFALRYVETRLLPVNQIVVGGDVPCTCLD